MLLICVIDDGALLSVVYDGASVDWSHSNYSNVTGGLGCQTPAKVRAGQMESHSPECVAQTWTEAAQGFTVLSYTCPWCKPRPPLAHLAVRVFALVFFTLPCCLALQVLKVSQSSWLHASTHKKAGMLKRVGARLSVSVWASTHPCGLLSNLQQRRTRVTWGDGGTHTSSHPTQSPLPLFTPERPPKHGCADLASSH